MSLFKTLMSIPDAPPANPDFESDIGAFGQSYGNRVASERRFRPPWHPHRRVTSAPAMPAAETSCDCAGD